MLPFTHMMDLLADKLPRLRAGRLTLCCILSCASDCLLVRHYVSLYDFSMVEFSFDAQTNQSAKLGKPAKSAMAAKP